MARTQIKISFFLFLVFIFISVIAHFGFFDSFDYSSTIFLQRIIPPFFDIPFALLSFTGSSEVTVITLGIIFYFIFMKKRKKFFPILLFFLIFFIEIVGKILIFHNPPPIYLQKTVFPFIFPSSSFFLTPYSYPSGHMARICFLVSFFLAYISTGTPTKNKNRMPFILCGIYILVMTVSRIYLGAHWFSDVIGGGILGISLGLLMNSLIYEKRI